jgi:hypothetical protein
MLVKPRLLTRGIRVFLPYGHIQQPHPARGCVAVRAFASDLILCDLPLPVRQLPCFRKWSQICAFWPVTAFMPMV